MNSDLFDRYTSTQMLAGEDVSEALEWSAVFFRESILPHLPRDTNARILDCACGYGRYLKALRDRGYANSEGVDISREQVAYARDKLGLSDVHLGDAIEFLDAKPDCYDVILMMDIIEHLDTDKSIRLISAARRGLRKGGKLVVVVPNALCPMNLYRYADITHERAYTVKSLGQSLRLGGFGTMRFLPLPPVAHGVASAMRLVVWHMLINPAMRMMVRLSHGSIRVSGGIHTGNMLAVALRE